MTKTISKYKNNNHYVVWSKTQTTASQVMQMLSSHTSRMGSSKRCLLCRSHSPKAPAGTHTSFHTLTPGCNWSQPVSPAQAKDDTFTFVNLMSISWILLTCIEQHAFKFLSFSMKTTLRLYQQSRKIASLALPSEGLPPSSTVSSWPPNDGTKHFLKPHSIRNASYIQFAL